MTYLFTLMLLALIQPPEGSVMKIRAQAFEDKSPIPKRYTCQGEDISPALLFQEVPKGTQSFVLIVEDPDAPSGVFDHWIVWDIPGNIREIPEGAQIGLQGTNGFGLQEYRGPCPPPGKPHRYFFKLYALDTKLSLDPGSTKEVVQKALKGHELDRAEIVGIFQR